MSVISKAYIFNLALGALLLTRRIANPDTDQSNEAKVLETNWPVAFSGTLADMDLDSTSTIANLELVATKPNDLWGYAYKYPTNCAYFRRIVSSAKIDSRPTQISKRVGIHNGVKVIFTDQENAVGEFIDLNFPLATLNECAALTIAYKLAMLSAPLIVGKGAKSLIKDISEKFALSKADAQGQDERESFSYEDDRVQSEFVNERLS